MHAYMSHTRYYIQLRHIPSHCENTRVNAAFVAISCVITSIRGNTCTCVCVQARHFCACLCSFPINESIKTFLFLLPIAIIAIEYLE